MTVPEDVREALVEALKETGPYWLTSDGTLVEVERAVDTVLAHLEQVGWDQPYDTTHVKAEPVYRIRKDAP